MSVTLVSRIMLNIRNPCLFGNTVSTVTKNTRSRPYPSNASTGTVLVGPFVTSPINSGLDTDSQSTTEPGVPRNGGQRKLGGNERLWYELDADWAGVGGDWRDGGADGGVAVSH